MQIGRRLYFELETGNIILDAGERSGNVIETTVEQDFDSYVALSARVPETVGMLQLEYGQYAEDFAACNGYRVDPDTEQVLFSYPDPEEPEVPIFQRPLTETVAVLESENTALKLALAELAETQEADKLATQLALAELAEIIVGGA
ncbi:hypothetical protein ACX93W_01990 [Paenibacillus sp. CAU 1782]